MEQVNFSVVVPVYNEELVIDESYRRLRDVMERADGTYELIFVNDGSRDGSLPRLRELAAGDPHVRVLSFSRNFGHQTAITAGMDFSSGEAVLVIDADLQDPPEVMLAMIEKWREGFEVVYGKRTKRKGETAFKKFTASVFYRTLNALTDVDIPVDTGDFRLLDRKVCDTMKTLPEHNRYVRGLVSWVGFRQTAVEYVREERFAGETKYPLKKMLKLAVDGLTSFSYRPLKLASTLGVLVLVLSGLFLLISLIVDLATPHYLGPVYYIGGFSFLLNGLVLLVIGFAGEYIGRICDEVRGRPLYIVGETHGFPTDSDRKDG
ncbi:glycosyltransferase family 2 protein [Oscillospiraceae bacterium OttesenSCG-928-G22]|nr:glycosyltransferase family 2 protein [Oscillospiraceae bacterium OttesenSCG-928-G22]